MMKERQERRALRKMVWGGRVTGWALVALAIVSCVQIGATNREGEALEFISSLALGLLGVAWIVALELFLKFFDRFLSRN